MVVPGRAQAGGATCAGLVTVEAGSGGEGVIRQAPEGLLSAVLPGQLPEPPTVSETTGHLNSVKKSRKIIYSIALPGLT